MRLEVAGVIESLALPCVDLLPRLRSVAVDEAAVESLARQVASGVLPLPAWDHPAFPPTAGPELDAIVWLGNALNFCYWVPEGHRMWTVEVAGRPEVDAMALFGALRNAQLSGVDLGDARWLADTSDAGPAALFRSGRGTLQLVEERVAILNEIGSILRREWGGRLETLIAAAPSEAPELARFLARTLPSFRDVRRYGGVKLPFLKRAQLAAGMWHGARVARGTGGLERTGQLTLYADYMLPRALRREGVLRYAPSLAGAVDSGRVLAAGSQPETEIRIATVAAGQLLVERARRLGAGLDALRLDFWLWRHGMEVEAPHHRVVTTDY